MRTYDLIFDGSTPIRMNVAFEFLLILTDGGYPVDISVRKNSAFHEMKGLQAGFGFKLGDSKGQEFIFNSSVAQTCKVFVGDDEAIYNRLSGNVTINGTPTVINGGGVLTSISNDVKTYDNGFDYGSTYIGNTALTGNTAVTVFSPAANANGAIVYSASLFSYTNTNTPISSLLAKTSAPANINDGDVLLLTENVQPGVTSNGRLAKALKVPAGKGVYIVSSLNNTTTANNVVYKLL